MQTPHIFSLGGGLDLVTPDIAIPDGRAIGGKNYESDQQGYRRFIGYERYDGRPPPSEASYAILNFTNGVGSIGQTIAAGAVVTGASSNANGVAAVDAVVTSGAFDTANAAGYLVLYNVSGTFLASEVLNAGSLAALATGDAVAGAAPSDALDAAYRNAAVTARRASIGSVPGSGPVRGVWAFSSDVYAIRDNAAASAGVLYRATGSGWSAQSLGHTLDFDAGTAEFVEGETVTGGTSAATATIERVILQGGTYSGNDADGFLVLSSILGAFQDNEAITSTSGAAVADGVIVANALPPGGRYEFVNHNFFGAESLRRMYAVSGVGKGFEWDGAVFTPLRTGLSDALDVPTHVQEFKGHLFLGYPSGSWLFSEIGNPLAWTVSGGAGEIAVGAEPTGAVRASGVLVLMGSTRIDYLAGSSAADFVLEPILTDSGAQRWATQQTNTPLYMQDLSLYQLEQSPDTLAGWRMMSMSQSIEPLLRAMRGRGVTPKASMRVKNRDAYRVFFSDGTGFSVYLGRGPAEIMSIDLPMTVECSYSGEETGSELLFVGADDGFVYQIDKGADFDGSPIDAFVRLNFSHCGLPKTNKRFHSAKLELEGGQVAQLSMAADFDYGSPDSPFSPETNFQIAGGGGFWDTALWNQFYWDNQVVGTAEGEISGLGRNISVSISSRTNDQEAHVLANVAIYWTQRRLVR
ncbi:MAG: hypothetical protein AAGC92_14240 [Pseudomonadota bacterium]